MNAYVERLPEICNLSTHAHRLQCNMQGGAASLKSFHCGRSTLSLSSPMEGPNCWFRRALWNALQKALRFVLDYFQERRRLLLLSSTQWCNYHSSNLLLIARQQAMSLCIAEHIERMKRIVAEEAVVQMQIDADEIARKALANAFADDVLRKIASLACKEWYQATKRELQQKIEASIEQQMANIMKEITTDGEGS